MLYFYKYKMHGRLVHEIEEYMMGDTIQNRQVRVNAWKAKLALKQQRRVLQKRLFGDHFNHSKVGLNKQKKYLLQQQRNTEIERSNRILLQKIQRISKRSVPIGMRKRTFTQQDDSYNHAESQNQSISSKNYQSSNAVNMSHQQLQKVSHGQFRSARGDPKILFKGSKEYNGKLILIKTFVENGRFTILADFGRMKQKIYLDIQNYRSFFRDSLDADHSKILEYLRYDGKLLELTGIKKQKIIMEEQGQLTLPTILNRSVEKIDRSKAPSKNDAEE